MPVPPKVPTELTCLSRGTSGVSGVFRSPAPVVRQAAVSASSHGTSETTLDSLQLPTLPVASASTVDSADALDERISDVHDTQTSFALNVLPVPAGVFG